MSFSPFATPNPLQQQSFFQTPAPTQHPLPQSSNFLFQNQQLQQQQQQHTLYLFTNDKSPARYNTKWADLHPDSQKLLLQIEERILEYRDESQRLDQCSRLYDSSVSNNGFELDAGHAMQELGEISMAMERERILMQELMTVAKDMLRNTEVAVRSFMMLHPIFSHPSAPDSSIGASIQTSTGTVISSSTFQSTSSAPAFEFYRGIPKRPSIFLQQTIARFEKYLEECRQWIEELEQLFRTISDGSTSKAEALLQSLPKVMSNVHDFFIHVAAKVENVHQHIESMKSAYLADQRRRGDGHDPFLEAEHREAARREAAARRVHPTLNAPAQPSTQAAGLISSSSMTGTFTAQQPLPSASSGSGFSNFNPSSSASTSSLFSTPAPTLFGMQTSASQPSSTPVFSTTASGFGANVPSFSSAPAFATRPLFSMPFSSGAAAGSGASFGTTRSTKPKSRATRR